MTVTELIAKLHALNLPNARVVTPGFDEGGIVGITVEVIKVVPHPFWHAEPWHEGMDEGINGPPETVVFIDFDSEESP